MKKILACIDGSVISRDVCDAACWVSEFVKAPIEVLHVLDKSEYQSSSNLSGNLGAGSRENLMEQLADLDEQRAKIAYQHGALMLENALERIHSFGINEAETTQMHGYFVDCVLDKMEETRVLVLGRQGMHHDKIQTPFSIGKHLTEILRAATAPVLVTLQEFREPKHAFLLAYDGSEQSASNLNKIARSPLLKGLTCHLVMVGDESDDRKQQLSDAKAELESHGFNVVSDLLQGEVHYSLNQYLRRNNLELLVMGAYGHSRIREFFVGSNTTRMISTSDVPILIMR